LDESVTQTLLRHAVEHDMDLLVMGAYSRPRAVEWMLGGVTRSMMREMCLPVLMSH
jgi:nucleotide-binding universal stress UspA family protein